MVKVKVKNYDENKQPKPDKSKKSRRSSFFLTINTNKKFNPHSEEYEQFNDSFKKSLNEIYNNIDQYVKIKNEGDTWNDDTIRDVSIESATEIGGKNNAAHAHVNLNFLHKTRLQLDYDKIKEKLMTDLNLQGLYLNNKLYYNNQMSLEEYLRKQYNH